MAGDQIAPELTNILASANYQRKIKEIKEAIEECTSNIQQVANLDYGKAKQLSYYNVSTYKLDELDFEPILVLLAGSGSGKNEVMQVLKQYVHKSHWITVCNEVTKAALREELNSAHLGTALIEEADSVPEGLLTRRPYKVSGKLSVFRPHENAKEQVAYFVENYDVFGATVLHRRIEFEDNAVRRRAMIVRWSHLKPDEMEKKGLILKKAKDLVCTRQMAAIVDIPLPSLQGLTASLGGIGTEVIDLWETVLRIALLCSDFDWLNEYALTAMRAESDEIEETMDVEPGALTFRVLLSLLDTNSPILRPKNSPKKLTPIKTVDISKMLYNDYKKSMFEKQVAGLFRSAGLKLKTTGGYARVYPTKVSLKQAAKVFGVRDEMIDDIDEWEEWKILEV